MGAIAVLDRPSIATELTDKKYYMNISSEQKYLMSINYGKPALKYYFTNSVSSDK